MELDDRITIATPEGVELDLQLAGLGSRFIAGMGDLIIQLVLIGVLALVTGALTGGGALDAVVFIIGLFVIWFGYPIAFELLARGRTPGKRVAHLRVVRQDAGAIDPAASTIRNFVRLIDGPTLLYVPTVLSILVTKRNQRPGDVAAGTLVIREEPPARGHRPPNAAGPLSRRFRPTKRAAFEPGFPAALVDSAGGWDLSGLTPADIAAARQFLTRREQLERGARVELGRRLANGLAAKVAGAPREGDAEAFLEALVEVKTQGSTVE